MIINKTTIKVFPEQNLKAYKTIFITSVIFFLMIALILYLDNVVAPLVNSLDFLIGYYLLLLSLCKFFITVKGLINNDIFRIFFNIYINVYICIYIIYNYLLIILIEDINPLIYLPALVIFIMQIGEIIYFYRFYYQNLPSYQHYYYKKLGASQKLNDAFRIRQKLSTMKEVLLFRMAYLLGSAIVFNLAPPIQDILQLIDIIFNLLVIYFLTFHLNCESVRLRIITLIAAFFSLIKDIAFIFTDFFISLSPIELRIDEIARNISYSVIYVFILYFGYKDYQLFGSGLKAYLKQGKRSRFGRRGRMRIR